jgi:hypothetical protein
VLQRDFETVPGDAWVTAKSSPRYEFVRLVDQFDRCANLPRYIRLRQFALRLVTQVSTTEAANG